MSATANPLKLRSQPATEKAKTMPVPSPLEPPVGLPGAEDPAVGGSLPPPIPSTPLPGAPVTPAEPVPQRLQAPVPSGSRPPARDLGIFGRIVVWGLLFTLVGGSGVGWFLTAHMVGSMMAGFTGEAGEGSGFDMGAMPQDVMQHFASTMESAMGMAALAPDALAPDAPEPVETGRVTLTAADPEAPAPRENPQMQEIAVPDLEWPDMQLNGVLIGSETWKGSVILDSEMVPLNSTFGGMKLVAVETYGAWFEYQGARKHVSVHDRTR